MAYFFSVVEQKIEQFLYASVKKRSHVIRPLPSLQDIELGLLIQLLNHHFYKIQSILLLAVFLLHLQ